MASCRRTLLLMLVLGVSSQGTPCSETSVDGECAAPQSPALIQANLHRSVEEQLDQDGIGAETQNEEASSSARRRAPTSYPTGPCVDGDVKVMAETIGAWNNNQPYAYYDGSWYPICVEGFADNSEGAKTICKSLGFSGGGVRKATGNRFDSYSMMVGTCNEGERMNECSGGGNQWGVLPAAGVKCSPQDGNGVNIYCTGSVMFVAYRTKTCEGGVIATGPPTPSPTLAPTASPTVPPKYVPLCTFCQLLNGMGKYQKDLGIANTADECFALVEQNKDYCGRDFHVKTELSDRKSHCVCTDKNFGPSRMMESSGNAWSTVEPQTGITYELLTSGKCEHHLQVNIADCLAAAQTLGAPADQATISTPYIHGKYNGIDNRPFGCILFRGKAGYFGTSFRAPPHGPVKHSDCGVQGFDCVCKHKDTPTPPPTTLSPTPSPTPKPTASPTLVPTYPPTAEGDCLPDSLQRRRSYWMCFHFKCATNAEVRETCQTTCHAEIGCNVPAPDDEDDYDDADVNPTASPTPSPTVSPTPLPTASPTAPPTEPCEGKTEKKNTFCLKKCVDATKCHSKCSLRCKGGCACL